MIVSLPLPVPKRVLPAEALVLDRAALGLGADQVGVAGAVALAERVAAGDERDGLLVVHRHAARRSRGCRGPTASGSGLPFGPSGFT